MLLSRLLPRFSRASWNALGAVAVATAGVFAVGAGWPSAQSAGAGFDLVLRGGRIVDGTGAPWFVGDVGVKGDTIAAVAPRLDPGGAKVLGVDGLIVAPGFVDVHSHAEQSPGIAGIPATENNVRQGVTTIFANPDGGGDAEVAAFLTKVEAGRPAVNVGTFIGQGAVRSKVMGLENRPATPAEVQRMRELVRRGMQEGAFGLSTGLFYVPGNYAPLDEVIELAKVAGDMGGIHQSHMRNEAGGILDSVRETIAIGERGGLPTQITHHKIIGKGNWGRSVDTLKMVDDARARGVDVTIDQYPYTASSTSIQGGLVPQWAQEGGRNALLERLSEPATGQKIRAEIARQIETDRGAGDPANVVLAACEWDPSLAGKSLADVLKLQGKAVTIPNAAELVVQIVQKGGCSGIFHAIDEDDLVRIMRHPATMIASDAAPGVPEFGKNVPHPRAYGTFARVLGRYVREKHVLTLEEAVRKMSSYPAQRMRVADRGLIKPGMKADLVVFDAAKVAETATFERPHQYAIGVSHVVVNGQLVLEGGTMTGTRPGRVLRLGGAVPASPVAAAGTSPRAAAGGRAVGAQPVEPVRDVVALGATRLETATWGEGELLVMLPGTGFSTTAFYLLGPELARRGYRAVAVNPRGVGRSVGALEGLTYHDYAADVAALIDRIGGGRAHVLGWAWGNRIARTLATDRPERVASLTLIAAGGKVPSDPRVAQIAKQLARTDLASAERTRLQGERLLGPGSDVARLVPTLESWPDGQAAQAAAGRATPLDQWWTGGRAPTLVVQGRQDIIAPPANGRDLKTSDPDRVTLVEIDGTGHAVLVEQPERVAEEIVRFVERHPVKP